MARKKKEVEHYTIKDGKVLIEEKDIDILSEKENKKISFYVKTLGYEVVLLDEIPKTRKTFTLKKAEAYIKENDKKSLKEFKSLKVEADKTADEYRKLKELSKDENNPDKPTEKELIKARVNMINEERKAFIEMKGWFIAKYGKDGYDDARKLY